MIITTEQLQLMGRTELDRFISQLLTSWEHSVSENSYLSQAQVRMQYIRDVIRVGLKHGFRRREHLKLLLQYFITNEITLPLDAQISGILIKHESESARLEQLHLLLHSKRHELEEIIINPTH